MPFPRIAFKPRKQVKAQASDTVAKFWLLRGKTLQKTYEKVCHFG